MSNKIFYFYHAPTWDWPPDGPIQLGNVLFSLEKPEQPLYTAPLPTTGGVVSTNKDTAQYSKAKLSEGGFSILTKFLSILGVGANIGTDAKQIDEELYSFQRIETTQFVPTDDYVQTCVDAPAAHAYLERCRYRKPVYIITGIKTVYGSKVKSQSSRSHGGTATVAVDGTLCSGGTVPFDVEPGVHGLRETSQGTSWEGSSDFVFAFRVRRVYVKRDTQTVRKNDDYNKGALLDNNIGKPTRSLPKVVVVSNEEPKPEEEGYDEVELMDGDRKVICAIPKPGGSKKEP